MLKKIVLSLLAAIAGVCLFIVFIQSFVWVLNTIEKYTQWNPANIGACFLLGIIIFFCALASLLAVNKTKEGSDG